MIELPAITLWQPWASLVAAGAKLYETRAFKAPPRLIGKRIAIHAALRKTDRNQSQEFYAAVYKVLGDGWARKLPYSAVLGSAILATSERAEDVPHDLFGDYSPGRFAWRLDDVRPFTKPIPAKGAQLIGWKWVMEDA